jgi:hypothetical protein
MRGTNVSGTQQVPRDLIAELVQVTNDFVKPEGQMTSHVLERQEPRPKNRDAVGDMRPQVPRVVGTHALAGV